MPHVKAAYAAIRRKEAQMVILKRIFLTEMDTSSGIGLRLRIPGKQCGVGGDALLTAVIAR